MNRINVQALTELIGQWTQIAAHMERGYTLTFDDYLNDLDLRRLIDERVRELNAGEPEQASHHLAQHLPEHLAEALSAADAVFMNATEPSAENVWGEENALAEGWTPEREWFYYRQLSGKSPPQ